MKTNIGILTSPIGKRGIIPLSNLVDILHSLSNDIYLITGNDGYTFFKEDNRLHVYGIRHEKGANTFTRSLKYIYTQLKISSKLAKVGRTVDIWIFFIGGDSLVLPMLTAKLLRKKVILAFASSPRLCLKSANDNLFKPVEILSKINCTLSNGIALCSKNLIKDWDLEKYKKKICIAYEHFIDFDKFTVKKKLTDRKNTMGYMGGLYRVKGILPFVQAIPKVLEEENGIKFVIGGDGVLFNEIKEFISKNKLNDKVKLLGWIPHDELSDYLNELKLLVIPSYTESGPLIALEAMSCGTPILATFVGHIPNIVKDGETGFIMENNSPECIAENMMRALEHPDLDEIVKNAREHIEREFTYEAAVERYRKILEGLL